ncbi:MAG: hypothetical protein IPG99_15030 [Ignavibacteria bacterium]|nr:hypothetical protein [Ignavibacteria bacterium]
MLLALLPRMDVNDWMIGGDILLEPSLDDGMAIRLWKVWSGIAVVIRCVSDVVQQNENGLIVPCNDAKRV